MDVHPTKNGINRYWSIPIWNLQVDVTSVRVYSSCPPAAVPPSTARPFRRLPGPLPGPQAARSSAWWGRSTTVCWKEHDICTYVYYIYIYMCVLYIHMYICVYTYVYIYMYIIYMYIYICIHIYIYTHVYIWYPKKKRRFWGRNAFGTNYPVQFEFQWRVPYIYIHMCVLVAVLLLNPGT